MSLARFGLRYARGTAIVVALLGSTGWGAASSAQELRSGKGPTAARYADRSDDSGWLPFDLHGGRHIYLTATINGHVVPALLDSGASLIVVNQPDAGRLGITPDGSEKGVGVGGTTITPTARNVSVSVGRLTIDAPKIALADNSDINARLGRAQSVVLGGEFFRDTVIDIDFARRRIAFRKPTAFTPPAGSVAVALRGQGAIRTVDAVIDGRPARMLFDLGNGQPVYLHPGFWNRPSFLAGRRQSTTLSGGFTGATPQKLAMLRTVRVGDTTFTDLPVTLRDSSVGGPDDSDGNIGMPIWSRFHLIVDVPRDTVFLAKPVDTTTPFKVNHTGLTLRRVNDMAQIDYVAPGSPADAARLKVKDRILSVMDLASGTAVPPIGDWTEAPVGRAFRLNLSDGRSTIVTTGRYF